MALPKIDVQDRKIILLNGYSYDGRFRNAATPVTIDAEDKLRRAVKAHPDATAFGYVAGQWVAGA